MDDSSSWLKISLLFLLASGVTAFFARSLNDLSGKKLNEYLRKKGRKEISSGSLEYLEGSASFFSVLEELFRIASFVLAAVPVAMGWVSGGTSFLILAGLLLASVILTGALPQALARSNCYAVVAKAPRFFVILGQLALPLVQAYEEVQNFFARAAGANVEKQTEEAVEEEILSAAEEGEREGVLEKGGRQMIASIIRFYDVEVREVMTPRTSMVCMEAELTLAEAVKKATACGHSRIPVYRESKDNIVGILYVKDLLQYVSTKEWEVKKVGQLVRKAYFVPESKKISDLFHEFRTQRFHIAVVLDEYGGTSGLVTIEDILEEIVGEIADEYETEKSDVALRILDDGTAEVDALIHIDELNEKLGLDLPEDDSYETLSGFLFDRFGRIPQIGEKIICGNVSFQILEADQRRIKRVRIRREDLS